MATMNEPDVRVRLQALPGWELDGNAIRRKFTFGSFPDAVAFTTRLAFDAEASDHHPDILINFKRVTLTYTTHSDGGLTGKDFEGAGGADRLARAMGGK